MDIRAASPPTLPRSNPTISYWQDPPDAIADLRSTVDLPETADVVIIGSGISGATIAYELLEGDGGQNIVMLEARQACSGATGRNGGHTKSGSYRTFLSTVKTHGIEEAVKFMRLEYNCIKAVHAFARTHSIDCDLFSGDTVDIFYDQGKWDEAHESVELMRKSMPEDLDGAADYTFFTAEEAQTKFFCKGEKPLGALKYPAGSLSAYKLVIGILELALAKGLNIQTNTPASELCRAEGGGGWLVKTDRGIVKAKTVVLATNGYTAYLFKPLLSHIVPLRGQVTAHRPGLNMPREGLETTYSFVYGDGFEYMIFRPPGSKFAGDIVIGGGLGKAKQELSEYGNTDDTELNSEITDYLAETTSLYFGQSWGKDDPSGRIRKQWSGIMGFSSDGYPFVGKVPNEEGLYISASFQGHGMVLCFLCAKALVQIVRGTEEEEALDGWFPNAFRITSERMQKRPQAQLH